ncbi:MAG: SPOR domain-containing protein [Solirubrobacterales bacterium]
MRPPEPPNRPRRNRVAIWVAAAIVVVGAGAALAILLASEGGSASTTVLVRGGTTTTVETTTTETTATETETTTDPATGSVEAGRYVQAGSFKTLPHADTERERLAAAGIDVSVVSSDDVEEFYPGFHVLLGGPLATSSEETTMVKALERNGVPSAFARDVAPALEIGDPAESAGRWSGALDRSSVERPSLNRSLPVTLEMDADGRSGMLEFETDGCEDELTLSETTATTLTYALTQFCAGSADLLVRPVEGQLMLSLLPLDTDVLMLGTLSPG